MMKENLNSINGRKVAAKRAELKRFLPDRCWHSNDERAEAYNVTLHPIRNDSP